MAGLFVDDLTPEQISNARDWIDALRSGGYQQAKGQLRKGDTFCCLGVACDVLGASWDDVGDRHGFVSVRSTVLPRRYVDALGLSDDEGVRDARREASLVVLNDDMDFSFTAIADVIEVELELVLGVPA